MVTAKYFSKILNWRMIAILQSEINFKYSKTFSKAFLIYHLPFVKPHLYLTSTDSLQLKPFDYLIA